MEMMGSIGRVPGGATTSKLLSALNIEMGSLVRDMAAATANVPTIMQSLQQSLGALGNMKASAMPAASPAAGQLSQIVAKIVFVSILNAAIEKASKNAHFNVETAINDLWVHLDAARKFSAGGGSASAAGSPSIDVQTQKLQSMMQKRSQLFSVLSEIMSKYDQSAKNVIQSMRG